MKATREELIEKAKELFDNYPNTNTFRSRHFAAVFAADFCLKINSEAGNETPTVTDNEAKKKVCQYCLGTKQVELLDSFGNVVSRKQCPYC